MVTAPESSRRRKRKRAETAPGREVWKSGHWEVQRCWGFFKINNRGRNK